MSCLMVDADRSACNIAATVVVAIVGGGCGAAAGATGTSIITVGDAMVVGLSAALLMAASWAVRAW